MEPDRILELLTSEFERNFVREGEFGAALSVWFGETELCSLAEGFRDRERLHKWTADTLVPVRDAIHGPVAATVLQVLALKGYSPESPIGEVWETIAAGTISGRSLGELLSHQCGLCVLDRWPPGMAHDEVVGELDRQNPAWESGAGHGYHARTFGYIADELVRRLTGRTLAESWRQQFGEALQLDIWVGSPRWESEVKLAEVFPPGGPVQEDSTGFFDALEEDGSLTNRAMKPADPPLDKSCSQGLASARSMARFYSFLAGGGQWSGIQLVPDRVCQWAERGLVEGMDHVLQTRTAFSAGFMKDPSVRNEGDALCFGAPPRAYGHTGSGGVLAFADPDSHVGFAYVMNQRDRAVLSPRKSLKLVRPIFQF